MNRGFIPDVIEPDHWTLGGGQLSGEPLQKDGQWHAYLPQIEIQRKYGVETSACVSFTLLNCIEILMARKYSVMPNFSERYTAILGNTTEYGAQPHVVAEGIRKNGVIAQGLLPFDETIARWEAFHSPKPMTQKYLEIGAQWLDRFVFEHDWVATRGDVPRDTIRDALKYSPLLVSVDAWHEKDGLYVKDKGVRDNHATTLYGYEDGKYWLVFDSYDNTYKRLAWDFDFTYIKRCTVRRNEENEQQVSQIIDMIIRLLQRLRSYRSLIGSTLAGTRFHPLPAWARRILTLYPKHKQLQFYARMVNGVAFWKKAPPELACAESVSTIWNILFGYPVIIGTWTMLFEYLLESENWLEVALPINGCVVIAATGTGHAGTIGHVGIYDQEKVWSNNSARGVWDDHFTIHSFIRRYRVNQGMRVRYFIPK